MSKPKTNKIESGTRKSLPLSRLHGREGMVNTAAANPSKLLTIVAMLRRPDRATIANLVEATGWKPNSF